MRFFLPLLLMACEALSAPTEAYSGTRRDLDNVFGSLDLASFAAAANSTNSTSAGNSSASSMFATAIMHPPTANGSAIAVTGVNMLGCEAFLGIPFAEPRKFQVERIRQVSGCGVDLAGTDMIHWGAGCRLIDDLGMRSRHALMHSHRQAAIRPPGAQGLHAQPHRRPPSAGVYPGEQQPVGELWAQRRLPHDQRPWPTGIGWLKCEPAGHGLDVSLGIDIA